MAVKREKGKKTVVCVDCGVLLTKDKAVLENNKYYCERCFSSLKEKVEEKIYFYPPEGFLRILCYILSFLSPLLGFILGTIYFSQNNKENKTFGKNCFIIMAIGLGVIFAFIIFSILFNLALFGINNLSFNIKEGYY